MLRLHLVVGLGFQLLFQGLKLPVVVFLDLNFLLDFQFLLDPNPFIRDVRTFSTSESAFYSLSKTPLLLEQEIVHQSMGSDVFENQFYGNKTQCILQIQYIDIAIVINVTSSC